MPCQSAQTDGFSMIHDDLNFAVGSVLRGIQVDAELHTLVHVL